MLHCGSSVLIGPTILSCCYNTLAYSLIAEPDVPHVSVISITASTVLLDLGIAAEVMPPVEQLLVLQRSGEQSHLSRLAPLISTFLISSLSPYTSYELELFAVNQLGEGPHSTVTVVTNLSGKQTWCQPGYQFASRN